MLRIVLPAAMLALVACAATGFGAEPLKAGDKAPDFELTGSDGMVYKLSDFVGKQPIVIAWYPRAFTGG